MINYESIIRDYKRAMEKIKEQEKEIERLKDNKTERNDLTKAIAKINELKANYGELLVKYNAMKIENNNLVDANVKLADTIKEYNPNHFGGGTGRHDYESPSDEEDYF